MEGMTFLLIFLFLMSLSAILPQIARMVHIPSVVCILLIGMAIGPNAFDLISFLNRIMESGSDTESFYFIIDSIGLLGLVFLMALAGMEVEVDIIKSEKKAVFWLSFLTLAIPAVAGYFVYGAFMPKDNIGKLVYASLFASHAVGLVFPIIKELKVVKTRFGISVLASTVITDIVSLVLLAVCIQMKRQSITSDVPNSISLFDKLDPKLLGNYFIPLFILVVTAFIGLTIWILPKLGKYVFERISPHDDSRLTFFLVGVMVVVLIGELLGISVIVGAFVAGMALTRTDGFHDYSSILHKKIEGMGYGMLIPFLFLSIGMKTDLPILFSAKENFAIVLLTLAALLTSKVVSGWLAMRISGFDNKKGLCAGLMTVPQLSATLAAASVALQLQMIDVRFFNAIVCLSILTTIPIPTLIKLIIVKGEIEFVKTDVEEETETEVK
ncbi:MAG: cation:proton antiporter [Alphaproteobacteria bacterium]